MAEFITAIRTTEGDKKYDYNALGNLPKLPEAGADAIKGTASGSVVRVNDVSPTEHRVSCRLTSDAVTNLSSVEVSRYGKNLIDFSKAVLNGCVIKGNGVQASFTDKYYMEVRLPYLAKFVQNNDGETLAFSVRNPAAGFRIVLVIMYTDGTYLSALSFNNAVSLKIDNQGRTVENVLVRPMASAEAFTDTTTVIYDLQLEFADAATEFDGYKGVATYTPNADGTVDGITSLSPSMTLLTDKSGVTINCEYNRDINKVIADLHSLINPASRIAYIDLHAAKWQGTASLYSQVVTIAGTTEYSKVDLNPSVEQLAIFHQKDIAFVTENEDGVVTVYCIGQKPTADYSMQVTITEVLTNG